MDRVTVFPDGELNVQAMASVPGTAAFSRPVSAGVCALVGVVADIIIVPWHLLTMTKCCLAFELFHI